MGRRGFLTNGEYQEIDGIAVYPTEYFCAVDLDVHEKVITDKTIAVHHYAGSWLQPSLKKKVQNVLKKTIGVENYRKLLHLKRKIVKRQMENQNERTESLCCNCYIRKNIFEFAGSIAAVREKDIRNSVAG
ncbi:MAG: hypothetical protein ACLVB1_11600 [Blautia obeum]